MTKTGEQRILSLVRAPIVLCTWMAATVAGALCMATEADVVGFAAVPAYGRAAVTGGGSHAAVRVSNAEEMKRAVERLDLKSKVQRENTPRVIEVVNDIDLGVLRNERGGEELKEVGKIVVRSHTTIFSREGATLRHGTLDVHGARNVIIRNLKFRDLWENDPSGEYDRLGWDYIRITNSGQTRSHHVWVDHCDFEKAYDGLLDITHGSDLITVSWCRFAGDAEGPHQKAMLIGHSSSSSAEAVDKGRLNVTLHHNWFQNIGDRAPRARFGNVHAFNNLIEGAENATLSVAGAVTLVERCVYRDVRIATTFSHAADTVTKGRGGTICIVGSANLDPRPEIPNDPERDAFELENNFKSNVARDELNFNAPADWQWENLNALPYSYTAEPVEDLAEQVRKNAGTRIERQTADAPDRKTETR